MQRRTSLLILFIVGTSPSYGIRCDFGQLLPWFRRTPKVEQIKSEVDTVAEDLHRQIAAEPDQWRQEELWEKLFYHILDNHADDPSQVEYVDRQLAQRTYHGGNTGQTYWDSRTKLNRNRAIISRIGALRRRRQNQENQGVHASVLKKQLGLPPTVSSEKLRTSAKKEIERLLASAWPESVRRVLAGGVYAGLKAEGLELTAEEMRLYEAYQDSLKNLNQFDVAGARPFIIDVAVQAHMVGLDFHEDADTKQLRFYTKRGKSVELEQQQVKLLLLLSQQLPSPERGNFVREFSEPWLKSSLRRPLTINSETRSIEDWINSARYRSHNYTPSDFDEEGNLKSGKKFKALNSAFGLAGVAPPGTSNDPTKKNSFRIIYWDGSPSTSPFKSGNQMRVVEDWEKTLLGWKLKSVDVQVNPQIGPVTTLVRPLPLQFDAHKGRLELAQTRNCTSCHCSSAQGGLGRIEPSATQSSTSRAHSPFGRGLPMTESQRNDIHLWHFRRQVGTVQKPD